MYLSVTRPPPAHPFPFLALCPLLRALEGLLRKAVGQAMPTRADVHPTCRKQPRLQHPALSQYFHDSHVVDMDGAVCLPPKALVEDLVFYHIVS